MKAFDLPPALLFGSATAATQIEGGDRNVNWYHWSLAGKVAGGESSLPGSGHWDRLEADTDLLAAMNQQCYRLSLEWSRLEPQEGQWSAEGLAHYRRELTLLRRKNIVPIVTLHHFSCPQWFQDRDAWLAPDAVETFLRFVSFVVENLGDLVDEWCTINEPNVFVNETYMDGHFPGGRKDDLGACLKASDQLIRAHLKAYHLIHRIRRDKGFAGVTKVGFAHHAAVFEAGSWGAVPGTWFSDRLFHQMFLRGFVEGKLILPLGTGRPEGRGTFCDFVGINYYSRHRFRVNANPATLFAGPVDPVVPAERRNDLGWEIYPSGLFQVAKGVWDRYHLPLFITENGIADARDEKREAFLRDHLAEVKRLLDAGAEVQRYCHWSFIDNFEWQQGYAPRFGLVEVDYTTMERRVRPSGLFYAEVCRTHRVPGGTQ